MDREGMARLRRFHHLQNDAADQQPFRCLGCGEAVSHIRRNPCKCIRQALTQQKPDE